MGSITRILKDIVAVTVEGVVEAGGPVLRRDLFKVACVSAILAAALLFLVTAAGFALAGVYLLLAPQLGAAGATFMCAAISLAVGLVLVLWAKSKVGTR